MPPRQIRKIPRSLGTISNRNRIFPRSERPSYKLNLSFRTGAARRNLLSAWTIQTDGCPILYALCERWDSTNASPMGRCQKKLPVWGGHSCPPPLTLPLTVYTNAPPAKAFVSGHDFSRAIQIEHAFTGWLKSSPDTYKNSVISSEGGRPAFLDSGQRTHPTAAIPLHKTLSFRIRFSGEEPAFRSLRKTVRIWQTCYAQMFSHNSILIGLAVLLPVFAIVRVVFLARRIERLNEGLPPDQHFNLIGLWGPSEKLRASRRWREIRNAQKNK